MYRKLFYIVLVSFFIVSNTASAAPIKRTILALYDSFEDPFEEDQLRYKRFAASVLNHLGMKMKYHDMQEGLPLKEKMKDVHGILTWFGDDSMADSEGYLRWLTQQIKNGTKVVIFEDFGAESNILNPEEVKKRRKGEDISLKLKPVPSHQIDKLFYALGLEYKGNYKKKTHLLRITHHDDTMMGFERDVKYNLKTYYQIVSVNDLNKVYLSAKLRGREKSETNLVITTPWGGYASYGTVLQEKTPDLKQQGWYLNPFKFFSEAFGLQDIPRPDVTTINGKRALYVHIDGDGFNNLSHIDRQKSLSAQFVYNDVLLKYKIPHTVSVIVGEIDPQLTGSKKSVEYAKKILGLPYVEVGSHGYGHPLDWEDHEVGMFLMKNKLGYKKADYRKEIEFSSNWINKNLLTPPKKVKIFQWTGQCNPPIEALKIPYEMKIQNINGGDTQFDAARPSIMGIAPLTRQMGDLIQYHTSNANENIYTNLWKGPFYGFRRVIETFQKSESPRRLLPMNIYYHFYSGERHAAMSALHIAYQYALEHDPHPIYTTEYVSMAEGFRSTQISKVPGKNNGWEINNTGELKTIRFDDSNLYPDMKKSQGILGFMHYQNALYVHLSDRSTHRIILTHKKPTRPYLFQSNVKIQNWRQTGSTITFKAMGIVPAKIRIKNLKQNHNVTASIAAKKTSLKTDENGSLDLNFPLRNHVEVSISL